MNFSECQFCKRENYRDDYIKYKILCKKLPEEISKLIIQKTYSYKTCFLCKDKVCENHRIKEYYSCGNFGAYQNIFCYPCAKFLLGNQ